MRKTTLLLVTLLSLSSVTAFASDIGIRVTNGALMYETGSMFSLTLTIDNTSTFGGGPLDTYDVVTMLEIPTGISFYSAVGDGATCELDGGYLSCTYPTYMAYQTSTIDVTLIGMTAGMYDMTAMISHGQFDPDPSNNTDMISIEITEPMAPMLTVDKSVEPETVRIGERALYTITVTNTGNATANGVQVQDILPAGLEFISSESCLESFGTVTCTEMELAPGNSAVFTFFARVNNAGETTNTASATSEEITEPETDTATVVGENRADLTITKQAAARVIPHTGAQIFSITVTNNGPDDATNVQVMDMLPTDSKSGLPVFDPPGVGGECSTGQTVTCDLGTIPAGGSKNILIGVAVNQDLVAGGPLERADVVEYTNEASVTTSSIDPDGSNNEDALSAAVILVPGTSGNKPGSESVSDPVSTFNGELHQRSEPDLHLTGPVSLTFHRYYGSFLDATGLVQSGFGPNWSHGYAWGLSVFSGTDVELVQVVSSTGRLFVFQEDDGGDMQQFTSLDAPMQLLPDGDEWILGDPRSGAVRRFDAEGRLVSVRHRAGSEISLNWAADELQSISDGLGRSLDFTWSAGRISSVTDGTRTVSYGYDGEGWLTSVTDAAGGVTSFSYDAGFDVPMMTEMSLPDGAARLTQTFDEDGRVDTQTDALGGTSTFTYDVENRVTTFVNPAGDTETHTYDMAGRLLSVEDADGTVQFEYDDAGRRTSITDRLGGVTSIEYDADSGLPVSVTNTDGTTATASYSARVDTDGITVYDLVERTDETGAVTSYSVDADGNRITTAEPDGPTRMFDHNARGQVTSVTVSGAGTTTMAYDGAGLRESVTDPLGQTSTFEYDGLGRLTGFTRADGAEQSFAYDALDRMTSWTNQGGRTQTYEYDVAGRLTAVVQNGDRAEFSYDALDRLVEQTDFAGNTVSFSYDAVGRVTSRTDRTGRTTTFDYDAAGNLTSSTGPGGGVTQYSYDAEGVLTSMTDPSGGSVTFSTDLLGRPVQMTDATGATATITRDAVGRVTAVTGPGSVTVGVMRDGSGRATAVNHPGGSAGYSYAADGRISQITTPLGETLGRQMDARGRLVSMTDALGRTTTYTYDTAGRVSDASYPDGVTVSYTHDGADRLTNMAASDAGSVSFTYDDDGRLTASENLSLQRNTNGLISSSNGISIGRDAEGRITSMTLPGGSVTYAYDATGRLSSVEDWDGRTTTFTYDAAGRVSTLAHANGITTEYDRNAAGAVAAIREMAGDTEVASITIERDAAGFPVDASYAGHLAPELTEDNAERSFDGAYQFEDASYDERGRLTSDERFSYTWNGFSHLTGLDGAASASMTYDGLGMLRSMGTESWTWNYAMMIPTPAVRLVDNVPETFYIHTPAGELLYSVSAQTGEATHYHYDEAGNTRLLTNDAGMVVGAYAFGPYGEPRGVLDVDDAGLTDQPFTWQGRYGVMDVGAGLYYMRSRFYDSETGRFVSPDPILAQDPLHLNPYQYAALAPTVFNDPLGQQQDPIGTALTAGGIIVTTLETLEVDKNIRGLGSANKALGGRVLGEAADGLLKGGKLAPNVSGLISAAGETYSSGNVFRGAGVGLVDVALTANPYTAGITIASDATDFVAGQAGIPPPKLAEIFRNGGRFVGSLATDVALSPFSDSHDFGDSLSGLADDVSEQGGIPGLLFEGSAQVQIYFGNEDLQDMYDAEDEAFQTDVEVRSEINRLRSSQRRAVERYLPENNGGGS